MRIRIYHRSILITCLAHSRDFIKVLYVYLCVFVLTGALAENATVVGMCQMDKTFPKTPGVGIMKAMEKWRGRYWGWASNICKYVHKYISPGIA